MNFQKYFKSTALINNPLCGKDTYKDVINLATGQITRKIKKVVFNGTESWRLYPLPSATNVERFYLIMPTPSVTITSLITSHLAAIGNDSDAEHVRFGGSSVNEFYVYISRTIATTLSELQSYLAEQYAANTPLTLWYAIATPETEQITVPSGLSGTVEGYLTQSGTPTPTDPIYPVANDAVGWYGIKNYERNTTWQDGSTYSRSGGSWSAAAKKRSRKKK